MSKQGGRRIQMMAKGINGVINKDQDTLKSGNVPDDMEQRRESVTKALAKQVKLESEMWKLDSSFNCEARETIANSL
jgi:hypothetical protein